MHEADEKEEEEEGSFVIMEHLRQLVCCSLVCFYLLFVCLSVWNEKQTRICRTKFSSCFELARKRSVGWLVGSIKLE